MWKTADISVLIGKFDDFIENSECLVIKIKTRFQEIFTHCFPIGAHNPASMAMYNELNTKIERMSKFFYILSVEIIFPASMILPLILMLVNYFVLDLKNESFYLPFPVM